MIAPTRSITFRRFGWLGCYYQPEKVVAGFIQGLEPGQFVAVSRAVPGDSSVQPIPDEERGGVYIVWYWQDEKAP